MLYLGVIIGAFITGVFVLTIWPSLVNEYGLVGGWLAAVLIIGSMWEINHKHDLIRNDSFHIDIALAVGIAWWSFGLFDHGIQGLSSSSPTLLVVSIGGIIGSLLAESLYNQSNEIKDQSETVYMLTRRKNEAN